MANPSVTDGIDNPGFFEQFKREAKRTIPQIKSSVGGSIADIGNLLGADSVKNYGNEVADSAQKDMDAQGQSATLQQTLAGEKSPTTYVGGTLGQVIPQGAASAVASIAGGLLLRKIPGGPEIAANLAERFAPKILQGIEATKLVGGALGAGAYSESQELGQIYNQRRSDLGGADPTRAQAGQALLASLPAAALDTASEGLNVGRFLKPGANIAKTIGADALTEGLTEAGQNVLERAGAGQSLDDKAAAWDTAENFAAGALGGGAFGVASHLVGPPPFHIIEPQRGVVSRAAAKGIQSGAINGQEVHYFNAPPNDGVQPGTEPPGAPSAMDNPGTRPSIERSVSGLGLKQPDIAKRIIGDQTLEPSLLDKGFTPLGSGYTNNIPAPLEDETNKEYAKRVIDKLPDPTREQIPTQIEHIFDLSNADAIAPIDKVITTKTGNDDDIKNAVRRIAAAAEGTLDRRKAIDVRANSDGTYTVIDGNGTVGALRSIGAEHVPVRIVESDDGKEGWRNPRGYLSDEENDALTKQYESAAKDKVGFDSTLNDVAKDVGGEAQTLDLKGRTRSEQKIAASYNGTASGIRDLLRGSIVANLDNTKSVVDGIANKLNVVGTKDSVSDGTTAYSGGYRDMKVIVQTPGGSLAEVIVISPAMAAAKDKAHIYYDKARVLDEKSMVAPLTEEEAQQFDALNKAQEAIYSEAWNADRAASKSFGATGTNAPGLSLSDMGNRLGEGSNANSETPPPGNLTSATGITGLESSSKNSSEPVGGSVGSGVPSIPSIVPHGPLARAVHAFNRSTSVHPTKDFGVIVSAVPGTKVSTPEGVVSYKRDVHGGNLPPVAAPVQRAPNLADLHERARAILKNPAAAAALKRHFGVTAVKVESIRGSYEGVPENSFVLKADGLKAENASAVAKFLGTAFAQDAVVVTKPDAVGPEEDAIPAVELYNTRNTTLSPGVFDAVAADLRAAGIDYSEVRGGKAIRVLHFGDEEGLSSLAQKMSAIAKAHGLSIDSILTRSDLYEAQDYRGNPEEVGSSSGTGLRPEVFRSLVDHFLVPYSKAVGSVGYRLDAERFAKRYNLSESEVSALKHAMIPKGDRSSVSILTGEETAPSTGSRRTNTDAAFFLHNRAAALGEINPNDHSPAAASVISDTFAKEIEYQLSKPDGKQAIGWYDRQLKSAIDTIATIHPDIASNPKDNFVFKALLAVTSQGLTVHDNFVTALAAYEAYKSRGEIVSDGFVVPGKASPSIKEAIDKIAKIVNDKGIDGARDYLTSDHTVRELRKDGFHADGRMSDTVKGWAAFGPKIGSFANNLNGDFDTLTADLWFSRTWNRALGNMFRYSAKNEFRLLGEFRSELEKAIKAGNNPVLESLSDEERNAIGDVDTDLSVANKLNKKYARDRYIDRSKLNMSAKNLTNNARALLETPRGDPERRWMQEVMKLTQSKIEQQTGKHISIADMQALLWYQEKELFNTLGAANKRSAPSDYEDAAQEAVRNSIENKLGFNRISPNYKITSNRMIKNERSGIYHDIGANTMARQFDSDQQKTVSRLLKQAVALGVPSEMVSGIKGFVASAGRKDSIARYYMNGPLAGHVMIDEALVNAAGMGGDVAKHAERTVLQNLVHEMAHAIDHAHSVDGMYSDHSPLFATERNKNGKIKYTGEVINELYNAWRDSTPLAYELSYPFDPSFDYPANVQRVEAFAQAAMLHFTEPELLAKHAPKTSAMFKEMFNDYESRSNQGKRFPAPVQEALRTDSVGAFDFESVASRPRVEGQRGDQDEQARAGAGAGSDGLGRELKPPAVKTVKIADLDLHPDGLATAKSKFMWEPKYRHENTAPIAVENRNGKLHVLDGYHRVVQAMRDGNKEIEVIEHQSPSDQTFDPNNPSIIYSRSSRYFNSMPPPGVGMDGATIPNENTISHLTAQASKRVDAYREVAGKNIDKFRTLFQDYFLPVQRAQDRIAAAGGKITEDTDVAGREEVYYGRTGEQLKQLEDKHVKPLISEMARLGVSQEDLELYAYAKFAPDRNARIAKINPKFPDGGSGMTNADAAQVLSDFKDNGMDKKLEPLWTRLQAMNESRVATLENAGLISKDEAAMWRSEKNYVPLKGVAEGTEDAGFQRTGQGFSIGGKEAHRALGRQSRATDIIANAIAQGEAAIIRAEKNRVATALLRLAQDNPNENLWSVDRVAEKPTFNENTGEVSYKKDSLHRLRDNVVQVKVDGEQHFVTLHDKQLAESMKNLGAAKMGAFLRAFSSLNRFFSLTRTTLAPEFVLANFSRDLQTAAINLSGEQSASMAAAVVKDVPNAIKAMYLHNRGNNPGGSWGREVQEFAAEGGMTNFVAQRTVEEQQKKIEGLLKEAKGGVVGGARKLVREVFGFVEDVNGAVENGVRLSAYSNARRAGMSKQDAARLAKNLTVNFNKKGSAGPALNALYMFYNASMQGSARFLTALKSPKVQKIMAATAVAGYAISMMNRSNAGDDDDGQNRFDKIPDWEKARNIIIFEPGGGGKYLKIPMPYTYNLPYLIGTSMESMINGKAKASSAAANITNAMLTSFNPIGDYDVRADSSQQIEKLASPTALDPLVDIVNNRNFFGAPISPEVSPFDKSPDPDSQRYFASTNPQAVWLADKLNSLTGGDKVKSGGIDVSPASMVYLFDYLTGGSGAFGERMATAISLAAKGEPVPSYKIPFYRVFAGELNEARVSQTYYAARDDVNQRIAEFKLGRAVGFDTESARTDALVGQQLNGLLLSTDKRMKLLRDRRKKADALGDEKTVDDIKVRERALQLRFAKAYFAKLGENE